MVGRDSFYITVVADTGKYNNKLNDFITDLPNQLEFNTPHEICLTESIIPYNILNVGKSTYFTILRLSKQKDGPDIPETEKYNKYTRFIASHEGSAGFIKEYSMYYAVRLRIPEGYYSSIDSLLDVIQKKARYVCANLGKYRLPPPKSEDVIEIFNYYDRYIKGMDVGEYDEFVTGHYITNKEISEYKRKDIDWHRADALNNMIFFNRVWYQEHTREICIGEDISLDSTDFVTELHMDRELGLLWGFDIETLQLYPNMRITSPYQVRLIPNDLFFIYTNVVNSVIVSGTLSQLLRIIPITNGVKFGELHHSEFKNLQYLQLNTQYLNSIRFTIRDIEGNLVKFLSGPHTIVLNLHIRAVKKD